MRKRISLRIALVLVVFLLITGIVYVKADDNVTDYPTDNETMVISDGFITKVGYVNDSNILKTEEYISQNINKEYADNTQLKPVDVIYVSHTLADGTKMPEEKTLQAMYDAGGDAYLVTNGYYMFVYETDENSDYYVALINTMRDTKSAHVTEVEFAYTNNNGEVISDAIYDENTGLAYIPKKYKEENKNGIGVGNVQAQLLQVCDNATPEIAIKTIVNVADNISGNVANTGIVNVELFKTENVIKLALDTEAKNNIKEEYIVVKVNGSETRAFRYDEETGDLIISIAPTSIDTLEIEINKDYEQENIEKERNEIKQKNAESGIMTMGLGDSMDFTTDVSKGGQILTWELTDVPTVGAYATIDSNEFKVHYNATAGGGNYDCSIYGWNDDTNLATMMQSIDTGSPLPSAALQRMTTLMQWWIDTLGGPVWTTDNYGVTYAMPQGFTLLARCVHVGTSLPDLGSSVADANIAKMRVLDVSEDGTSMVIGMITPKSHTQSGGGIYKISIKVPVKKGELVVGKKEKDDGLGFHDLIGGATFHITGPDGFNETWTSVAGETKTYTDLTPGTYRIEETDCPTGMYIGTQVVEVNVDAGGRAEAILENQYQRGSVTLTKYNEDNKADPDQYVTLAGAEYELHAAETIKEGNHVRYEAGQLVKGGIVTNADGTTEVIDNLPVGSYYYVETKASEGFALSTERVNARVNANAKTEARATNDSVRAPEGEIHVDLVITKRLGATDYDPEINLAGVKFKVTLMKKDGSLSTDPSQIYYSTVTGSDGKAYVNDIPYGKYHVEEIEWPPEALKGADFDIDFTKESGAYDGKVYDEFVVVNTSVSMRIAVTKEILLHDGEATDAHVDGAYFTVYKDAQGTQPYVDKNGRTVVIGPTDENGYAISGTMRTGVYYLKETTFPVGIDPDAVIPGENVTYRNKVYTVTGDNTTQEVETVTIPITIQNEPNRNDIEIIKELEKTSNTSQFPLDGCEFTATLISSKGTDYEFSRKCTAETTRDTGYCIIEDLPYGTYEIEETKVSPISLKCSNFTVFVSEDRKVKTVPYEPKDGTFKEQYECVYENQHQWLDEDDKLVDISKKMKIKIRKTDIDRTTEAVDYTQGDAHLEGAIYQIYRYDPETDDYTEYVYDITIDHKDSEGYWCAESDWLLVGKYCVKEKIKSSEMVDGKQVNYSYAEGYLVDPNTYYYEQKPDEQLGETSYHVDESKEEVARGTLKAIKYNNVPYETEDSPAKGAILRLTLDSNPDIYYDVTINEYGYGEFIDTNDELHSTSIKTNYGYKYYPYTIPYGKYTVKEIKESDTGVHLYIQTEDVEVAKVDGEKVARQGEIEYRIEADEPIPFLFNIIKKDKDTGNVVQLKGAKFKIWDCTNNCFIEQKLHDGSHEDIYTFEVNDKGYLYTPDELYPGDYIIYETQSPQGYYLEDSYRLPEKEEDYGKVGGKRVTVRKDTLQIPEDMEYPEGGTYLGQFIYKVEIEDRPLKGVIELYKKGEMFTQIKDTEYDVNGEKFNGKYPLYSEEGLNDVTFKITAVNDIYSPDKTTKYRDKGWSTTMTTGANGAEDGVAISEELYNGEYLVEEIDTPKGYLPCDPFNVVIDNQNPLERVKIENKEAGNIYLPIKVRIDKEFEREKEDGVLYNILDSKEEKAFAIFGIYNAEELTAVNGQVIPEGTLIQTLKVVEGEGYVETCKLPDGEYFLEELYTSSPFTIIDKETDAPHRYDFTVVHKKGEFTEQEVKYELTNTYPTGDLYVVKVSDTGVEQAAGITLRGNDDTRERIKEFVDEYTNTAQLQIANGEMDLGYAINKTVEDFKVNNEFVLSSPAEYVVYTDADCTQKLRVSRDGGTTYEDVKLIPNRNEDGYYNGSYSLTGLPVGQYYVKETEGPVYVDEDGVPHKYEVEEEPILVEVMGDGQEALNGNNIIFRVFTDESQKSQIDKRDMFTGKGIPNCHFTITDEDDNELLDFVTFGDGTAEIPTDIFEDGKYYYFTELEAPGFPYYDGDTLYELNTEPHKFRVEYEEETDSWKFFGKNQDEYGNEYGEEVEKPVIYNFRPRTDIELQKLDMMDSTPVPNCKFRLESKERDWVVEGVTDENGIYVFKDVPYGEYTYTELEAPEEYLIDTTPHDFTHDSHGTKIVVYDERAIDVDTGDIAVIAIVCIALVSIAGIVFLVIRKKKANSKK